MTKAVKDKYQNLIVKTIEHLEKTGHTEIKADVEGYENPTSFSMKKRGETITPDIVSRTPKGTKHYVEVGAKSDQPILLKSKWKFLQTLSEIKNGSFRVVSHRGHYAFTDKIIAEMNSVKPALRI